MRNRQELESRKYRPNFGVGKSAKDVHLVIICHKCMIVAPDDADMLFCPDDECDEIHAPICTCGNSMRLGSEDEARELVGMGYQQAIMQSGEWSEDGPPDEAA